MAEARRRVAITGIGMVTPLGNNADSTWRALLAGKSGTAPIESFDASGFSTRIGAEVKNFDRSAQRVERATMKYTIRPHRFAIAAADEAFADAEIKPNQSTSTRWACVSGSGMMGVEYEELAEFQRSFAPSGEVERSAILAQGSSAGNPVAFCRSQVNQGIALLLNRFEITGYASSLNTACASGGQAIGTALKVIRRGAADYALAGGFDSMLNPVGLASFCLLGALSTDNDAPEQASRPFDLSRSGFVLGEGAAFLVLEEWQSAMRRGARIYAELAGEGNSLSCYRITDSHPSGDGPIQAMRQALRDARTLARKVDYINAHGTSTQMNDRSECAAIRTVFDDHADRAMTSSTKSMTGHLIAAAGALEAAICALAIKHSMVPINANLHEMDPACELNFVRDHAVQRRVGVAISNSFGFGGSNNCLVFRNPDSVRQ
jgi:3-oxoacyl-[acyl-carrier-protein] synthase II